MDWIKGESNHAEGIVRLSFLDDGGNSPVGMAIMGVVDANSMIIVIVGRYNAKCEIGGIELEFLSKDIIEPKYVEKFALSMRADAFSCFDKAKVWLKETLEAG